MHFTAPTDDFRKAAEAVHINVEEMVPVEGQRGLWRLPLKIREKKREVSTLVNIYNGEPYGSITKRAESRGLRLEFDEGFELVLLQGTLPIPKNRMLVAIIVRISFVPQCGSPAALSGPYEGNSVPDDTGKPSSPLMIGIPGGDGHRHKRQKTMGATAEKPLMQKWGMTSQAKENMAPNPPRVPEKSQTGKGIDTNILQKQPETLVTKRLETSFSVGYILELYDVDAFHARAGSLAMILMRYRVEKLVKGAENQDAA